MNGWYIPAMIERSFEDAVVFVLDNEDDPARVKALLESVGLRVVLVESPRDLLETPLPDTTGCLVLDVRLGDTNGLHLQQKLAEYRIPVPLVFVTGHGTISMAVRAMKQGAADFLTKPVREQELLDAVFSALERDRKRRTKEELLSALRRRFSSLSTREREVLERVSVGRLNKQIAAELGLSEVMVKVHRAHLMRKMQAKSLAELVRMVDLLFQSNTADSR
jgi:FixJ family two-component response regulator